jgi:von Willebrand factor type A domain
MKIGQVLLTCVVVVLATLLAGGKPAHAARRMLVLIDASGSMITLRNNSDGRGANRFEAAKNLAADRVNEQAAVDASVLVSVYTFRSTTTLIPHTAGFVDFNQALNALDALSTATDVGGSTPLAGAMCQAADVLTATDASIQILQVSSDGEENSTPLGTLCQGDLYNGPPPYPPTSWEAQVINHLTPPVIVRVDLFNSSQITLTSGPDPEGILPPQARWGASATRTLTTLTPLEQFFTILTEATGGQLTIAHDEEVLPLSGDLNNDRCVDRADAILVARSFGSGVSPSTNRFDLNLDRTINFADYQLQASRITASCGPDPYIARPPVACTGPKQIVIDGAVIENGGTTIDVRSACQVVIRNSLIVSGLNSINIDGSAVVKVDNSIIVGQNALIGTRGTIILSAANSIFHGLLRTNGALNYINRGGNIFE